MSYCGWWGNCPKCGFDKGTYKVIEGIKKDNGHDGETVVYQCNQCHWEGNYNEILNEEQWINLNRFKILNEILNDK